MQIVCPNCATSYQVEPSSLGDAGRSVRCVRCRAVWFARDPGAIAAIAEAYRSDIAAFASDQADDATAVPADHAPLNAAGSLPPPGTDGTDLMQFAGEALASPERPFEEASPLDDAESPIEDDISPRYDASPAISDSTPPAQTEAPIAPLLADATVGEDVETVAARRARHGARHRLSWPVPALPTTIMALMAIVAVIVGWRADVVKIAPQTASLFAAIGLPVNLRGLTFVSVVSKTETQDGVPVLVVEGTIVNAVRRPVEVPRLRFSVRNQRGEEVYAWTALPARSLLAAGESQEFRSRLASPPPDGRNVLVRFFNRRDLVAGIQ